jgi:hypothetical protein
MSDSFTVGVLNGRQYLFEIITTNFLSERSDGNIAEELTTFEQLHHDVGNFYFAAVSFYLQLICLKQDEFNDVWVL